MTFSLPCAWCRAGATYSMLLTHRRPQATATQKVREQVWKATHFFSENRAAQIAGVFAALLLLYLMVTDPIVPPPPSATQQQVDAKHESEDDFLSSELQDQRQYAEPETVYGLMMDAGSTGSRIHTYIFERKTPNARLSLVTEHFDQVKGGLGSYKDDPAAAAESLEPLLELARSHVPADKHFATPVFLYATAGLRLIGDDKADAILDAVRSKLQGSNFLYPGDHAVSIMSGTDEGIYSWLTVNFLMDRMDGPPEKTVPVLDLGGGSTQVTFVPKIVPELGRDNTEDDTPEPGQYDEYFVDLPFGGRTYRVYTHSFLGFGLYEFQRRFFASELESGERITHCLPHGEDIGVKVGLDGQTVNMRGYGHFGKCATAVKALFNTDGECEYDDQCTIGMEYLPKMPEGDIVAFAYYFDKTVGIGLNGMGLRPGDLRKKGEELCAMSIDDVRAEHPTVPNGTPEELCFTSAYLYSLMTEAWGVADDEPAFTITQRLKGIEFGWALGAMFKDMDSLGLA